MKSIQNPPNPFASHDCEYLEGMIPPAKPQVFEDNTRNILSENKSPDLFFRWSLNPYRGCAHACIYCYARPTHEYLDFGAGTDFETKIVIKKKAPELLRKKFLKRSWRGELILFSGDTDCYQPLEANYKLTQGCLEACLEFGNPVGIITKSSLILRDLDLLEKLHERTHLSVTLSIPFIDDGMARLVEPNAASISRRFEVVRQLAERGLDVTVNIAPLIPGLNDSQIPEILKKAKAYGAQDASIILLRLPGSVKEVFASRIREMFPLAAEKILGRIRESRGGKIYDSNFGKRMKGKGDYWETLQSVFDVYREKVGFPMELPEKKRAPFRRPTKQKTWDFLESPA